MRLYSDTEVGLPAVLLFIRLKARTCFELFEWNFSSSLKDQPEKIQNKAKQLIGERTALFLLLTILKCFKVFFYLKLRSNICVDYILVRSWLRVHLWWPLSGPSTLTCLAVWRCTHLITIALSTPHKIMTIFFLYKGFSIII